MPRNAFVAYTDGGCWPNPGGVGGWAFVILQCGLKIVEMSGAEESTTNNRMEVTAAIRALQNLPEKAFVIVFTDSQYLQNGANWWSKRWVKKQFRGVKNSDLWRELVALKDNLNCEFRWVRGHNDDKWNEYCDQLAAKAVDDFKQKKETNERISQCQVPV